MSGQDSRPQAPRRKKLVLRKIAVDGASVPDTWSNSYTGPLPAVRPPPRPSVTNEASLAPSDAEPADYAEPEIISEIAIFSTVIVAPSPDAWAAAAMTAAVARPVEKPLRMVISQPGPMPPSVVAVPVSPLAPLRTADRGSRTTVSPVVATLATLATLDPATPDGLLSPFSRGRFSLDSKVLAAGGAAAAAMLLVALGVFMGVRSTRSAASTASTTVSAAAVTASPVNGKATGSTPTAPPAAVDVPTVAPSTVEKIDPRDTVAIKAEGAGMTEHAGAPEVAPKADVSLTIDVSQLPAAQPARRHWAPVAPKAPQGPGWMVASTPAARGTDGNPATPGWSPSEASAAPVAAASAAPIADEIPAATPPPVDPLVQAVREDIREDEARTK